MAAALHLLQSQIIHKEKKPDYKKLLHIISERKPHYKISQSSAEWRLGWMGVGLWWEWGGAGVVRGVSGAKVGRGD